MNIVNVLARVKRTYEDAMKDNSIKNPVTYSLEKTYKWAEAYEKERKTRRRENEKELGREVS